MTDASSRSIESIRKHSSRDHKKKKHRRMRKQLWIEMSDRRNVCLSALKGEGMTTENSTPKQPATEPVLMKVAQEEVVQSAGGSTIKDPETPTDVSAKAAKIYIL